METTFRSEVLDLFLELAAIPSPSGAEEAVAERVTTYLRQLGLQPESDEAGNVLVRLAPTATNGGEPIFLCAHMDTVPVAGPIEPVVEEGVVRNGANTILGADDKAAVAVLLEAARTLLAERRSHAGVELLFTVREETGLDGAKAFDHARLRARAGFVYDYSGPVGDVVAAAPSARKIDVVFRGRPAHAGINPEEGRSAIYAAAKAVADLRLGRIDEETTANVGRIEGEVETNVEESYRGYRLRPDDPAFVLALTALERAGFPPRPVEVGGGADANVFNARGLSCVNLANGMAHVHTAEEEIAVADLDGMLRVTLELVEAARSA